MHTFRIAAFLLAIAAAMVVAPSGEARVPSRTATSAPTGSPSWMPDVAERVAALRERSERAAVEVRERQHVERARGGQWWRAVAAVPPQGSMQGSVR